MKDKTLKQAIAEAKRFIRAAKQTELMWDFVNGKNVEVVGRSGRINGAIRRASMDLSNKLFDLRAGR